MSRRGTLLGSLIALLVLAGVGWLAWDLTHQPPASAAAGPGGPGPGGPGAGGPGGRGRGGTPPTTVGVATAAAADVPITLEALGTVTPTATAIVRAQVSGVLQQVLFREGQEVKPGQLLATLDPRQFEMALMQASGQRLRDEAQLENARLTLTRYQTLLAQDSIARQEVDTQAALVKQLEGTIAADRAAEGAARINVGYTRIVAPIAGRVGLRVVDVGNLVGSNDANGIAVITQLAPIDVEFAIPQDRVPEVQRALRSGTRMPATALDRTRTEVLATGMFETLDNVVDPQTGTVRAKARFRNTDHTLFPNQFVNVRLVLRTLQGEILIPVSALRHGSTGDYVFVLNPAERTVAQRPVTQGPLFEDKVVIAKGLEAGEQVITEGADRLRDGARVLLPGDTPPAGAGAGRGAGKGGRGAGAKDGARGAGTDGAAAGGGNGPRPPAAEGATGEPPFRRRNPNASDAAGGGGAAPNAGGNTGAPQK